MGASWPLHPQNGRVLSARLLRIGGILGASLPFQQPKGSPATRGPWEGRQGSGRSLERWYCFGPRCQAKPGSLAGPREPAGCHVGDAGAARQGGGHWEGVLRLRFPSRVWLLGSGLLGSLGKAWPGGQLGQQGPVLLSARPGRLCSSLTFTRRSTGQGRDRQLEISHCSESFPLITLIRQSRDGDGAAATRPRKARGQEAGAALPSRSH